MSSYTGCVLTRSTAQAIADSTYESVVWQTELLDTMVMHAPSSVQIEAPPGWTTTELRSFLVTAYVRWAANTTGQRRVRIMKNSSVVAEAFGQPSVFAACPLTISAWVEAVRGDTFTIHVWQNSGASLDLDPTTRCGVNVIP